MICDLTFCQVWLELTDVKPPNLTLGQCHQLQNINSELSGYSTRIWIFPFTNIKNEIKTQVPWKQKRIILQCCNNLKPKY